MLSEEKKKLLTKIVEEKLAQADIQRRLEKLQECITLYRMMHPGADREEFLRWVEEGEDGDQKDDYSEENRYITAQLFEKGALKF